MQNTWLALAHHGIPAQAVFDFWMKIRSDEESDPFLLPQNRYNLEFDAALSAARRFLRAHYSHWANVTAPGWNTGLAARREWSEIK